MRFVSLSLKATRMKKTNIKLLVLDVDGTMTDGGIYVMEDGSQFKKFNAQDGLGIKRTLATGVQVGIISHSLSPKMVSSRANALGLEYVYIGQEPKLEILNAWLEKLKITLDQVAYIGDDLNDLEVIKQVGFSACPANGVENIKRSVDVVLSKKGGDGAVREFVDRFIL